MVNFAAHTADYHQNRNRMEVPDWSASRVTMPVGRRCDATYCDFGWR